MTAVDSRTTQRTPSAPARWWNVVKLHQANPVTMLVTPVWITLAILALTVSIWWIVVEAAGGRDEIEADAFIYNGGGIWILFFFMTAAIQAMSQSFRFALGFSLTRRDYYIGTVLTFVLLAAVFATFYTVLAVVERATDGWGVQGAFFGPFILLDAPLWELWLFWMLLIALFLFLGAAIATVWMRWRANGMYVFFIGSAVVLIVTAWLVTQADGWPAVGRFFVDRSVTGIIVWTIPVSALSALLGYLFLRRSTPRS